MTIYVDKMISDLIMNIVQLNVIGYELDEKRKILCMFNGIIKPKQVGIQCSISTR